MVSAESNGKWTPDYKFCRITGSDGEATLFAYLDSGGSGEPVLFLHEFASFSYTWEKMLPFLPASYRYIRLDCIGFGYTVHDWTDELSTYNQAELIAQFILKLNLSCLTIIGHGMGGEIALLLMNSPLVRARVKQLMLISCGALEQNIPEFIDNIARSSLTRPVLRLIHSRFVARMMLTYGCAPGHTPDPEAVSEYGAMLKIPGRIQSIISAARSYNLPLSVPRGLQMPVTILCGEEDKVYPPAASLRLHEALKPSDIQMLSSCGHLPQEEFPQETALLIRNMLDGVISSQAEKRPAPKQETEAPPRRPLKMRRLFDYWNLGSVLIIITLKLLQFFRHLGVSAETHGWRKVTGIFLKKEYSKFVIASFRLSYCSPYGAPEKNRQARDILIGKLKKFLTSRPELQWTVEVSFFLFRKKKLLVTDIMEAAMDRSGRLLSIIPHFDERHPILSMATQEQVDFTIRQVIEVYNDLKDSPPGERSFLISKALKKRIKRRSRLSMIRRKRLTSLTERIMSATFLYFEGLPQDPAEAQMRRFKTPDFKRARHPGWGLLCIAVRFTTDLSEADLWWQFNHVPVDGAPMQEALTELKRQWGAAGNVVYPAMNGTITRPETMYCGDRIFRARFYMDFSPLMKIRKYLNANYRNEMNGSASLAGLLMWGLSRHPFFRRMKMLLPVDWYDSNQERELGLLIIRPGVFDEETPRQSFFRFQREMNRRLAGIRHGNSESLEFLALCTMLHPMFYLLVKKIAPAALSEIVGTMGISIIRDAEVFVSPLTDLQSNGFMSLGSTSIPTADGRTAGSVCICGSRSQIRCYYEAISTLEEQLAGLGELMK